MEPAPLAAAVAGHDARAEERRGSAATVRGAKGTASSYGVVGALVMTPFDGVLERFADALEAEASLWNEVADSVRMTRLEFEEADATHAALMIRLAARVGDVSEVGW